MKLIKNYDEINKISKACQLISEVHQKVGLLNFRGMTEMQVSEFIMKCIHDLNISELAFPVIVGSGVRSLILHAEPTEKIIEDNDLVLIDMGLKYNGYCSDMTRTYSANGQMSEEQNTIENIVRTAQQEFLNSISKKQSLSSLHDIAKNSLCRGLDAAGLRGCYDIQKIYPHKTSHWIGQDVHDRCAYIDELGHPILLKPGMCFTVEPGLYIQNTNTKYDGIGIRIEDVVVVTDDGFDILSV